MIFIIIYVSLKVYSEYLLLVLFIKNEFDFLFVGFDFSWLSWFLFIIIVCFIIVNL